MVRKFVLLLVCWMSYLLMDWVIWWLVSMFLNMYLFRLYEVNMLIVLLMRLFM